MILHFTKRRFIQPQKWMPCFPLFFKPRFSPVHSKCSYKAFYTCSYAVLTVNAIYEKRNLQLPAHPGFSKLWEFPLHRPRFIHVATFVCDVLSAAHTAPPCRSLL
jgi:hypothetical protein